MEEKVDADSGQKAPVGTLVLFFLFLLIVSAVLFFWRPSSTSPPPQELVGVLRPEPKALENFELVDQRGERFDRDRLLGRWSFLFLGYTHCPDVCPATLSILSQVQKRIADLPQPPATQMVFVSVDPQRDGPERLAEYLNYFNPDFIGLTGKMEMIDAFVRQLGAGYMRGEETSPGNYVVNHTSAIFLVDPDARSVAAFSQPHDPDTIVELFDMVRIYLASRATS